MQHYVILYLFIGSTTKKTPLSNHENKHFPYAFSSQSFAYFSPPLNCWQPREEFKLTGMIFIALLFAPPLEFFRRNNPSSLSLTHKTIQSWRFSQLATNVHVRKSSWEVRHVRLVAYCSAGIFVDLTFCYESESWYRGYWEYCHLSTIVHVNSIAMKSQYHMP